MKKRKTLLLRIAVMGIFLLGVAACQDWSAYAGEWLNAGYDDAAYQQQYYPYFGQEFFTSVPADPSQQAVEAQRRRFEAPFRSYFGEKFLSGTPSYSQQEIEAQRQRFEAPYLPFFGVSFFSAGEMYPFIYPDEVFPRYSYPSADPSTDQYPWMSRPVQPWPSFQKNWTKTADYARSNSSFRIYSGGTWSPA